jgi:hypothetical protein
MLVHSDAIQNKKPYKQDVDPFLVIRETMTEDILDTEKSDSRKYDDMVISTMSIPDSKMLNFS